MVMIHQDFTRKVHKTSEESKKEEDYGILCTGDQIDKH